MRLAKVSSTRNNTLSQKRIGQFLETKIRLHKKVAGGWGTIITHNLPPTAEISLEVLSLFQQKTTKIISKDDECKNVQRYSTVKLAQGYGLILPITSGRWAGKNYWSARPKNGIPKNARNAKASTQWIQWKWQWQRLKEEKTKEWLYCQEARSRSRSEIL